ILVGETLFIDDERPAGDQVADVRHQRRRVHRDEDVELIAGGEDVFRGELQLEARDPGLRAPWGANFGRKVGKGRDVVAGEGGRVGQLRTDQLHSVAGVSGEPDGGSGD